MPTVNVDSSDDECVAIDDDSVKVEVTDEKQMLAFWPSTGVPFAAQFKLQSTDGTNKLTAFDADSRLTFNGDNSVGINANYYVGVREGNTLRVMAADVYRMWPIISMDARLNLDGSLESPLTVREQMDEIKEKFGSRRSKKQLSNKRKYAIHFGDDDVDGIDANDDNSGDTSRADATAAETAAKSELSFDILPTRNMNAASIEAVYHLSDIIEDNEMTAIKKELEPLFNSISNQFILNITANTSDDTIKTMAIYLDLLLKMYGLKHYMLNKGNPMPELSEDISKFLLERYAHKVEVRPNKYKLVISDKQKDRLLINCVLLSFMMSGYKPLSLESIQTSFKVPIKKIRKIAEVIGCYYDSDKQLSGVNKKCIVLRLPLNIIQKSDNKRSKRR